VLFFSGTRDLDLAAVSPTCDVDGAVRGNVPRRLSEETSHCPTFPQQHRSCLLHTQADTVLEPSGGASGTASDVGIHAKEILRIRSVLTEIYADHCKKEGEEHESARKRFGEFLVAL
jgi:hypothetical protein